MKTITLYMVYYGQGNFDHCAMNGKDRTILNFTPDLLNVLDFYNNIGVKSFDEKELQDCYNNAKTEFCKWISAVEIPLQNYIDCHNMIKGDDGKKLTYNDKMDWLTDIEIFTSGAIFSNTIKQETFYLKQRNKGKLYFYYPSGNDPFISIEELTNKP
jgi:hypothetical protein